MEDTAAFKLDALPDVSFTVTRSIDPEGGFRSEGFLKFTARREIPAILSESGGSGPVGNGQSDTPRIRGGKVPFVFRSLPGYTFCALRSDETMLENLGGMTVQRSPGWIRITYYGPGDDEEHEWGGFAGPET
ncbi:hypothetical protein [Mycolicibacterium neoaurum]|uniref:hypothetical protein n=1 Tax=Mycolicibacterium neoaurum TaxID=1795 RepID=UPI0004BE3277|nr:hypothetical protein [Mycolicibacterium neoaurum]TLH63359.1 hypothetical protein C1S81_00775 [Mycolicibacterium neoaurum]